MSGDVTATKGSAPVQVLTPERCRPAYFRLSWSRRIQYTLKKEPVPGGSKSPTSATPPSGEMGHMIPHPSKNKKKWKKHQKTPSFFQRKRFIRGRPKKEQLGKIVC